jgi:hypothetical protein
MIGKYKASLENAHDKALRDARDNAMESTDYKNAMAAGNGAEAGHILAKAEADAEAAYRQTDGFKQEQNSQIQLVGDVQKALAPVYKSFGYSMGQEFSKGLAAAVGDSGFGVVFEQHFASAFNRMVPTQKAETSIPTEVLEHDPLKINSKNSSFPFNTYFNNKGEKIVKSNATGIFRVPYNDYPTLLHEDEKVLTGVEARSQKSNGFVYNNYAPFTVREEADIGRIARSMVEELKKAAMIS